MKKECFKVIWKEQYDIKKNLASTTNFRDQDMETAWKAYFYDDFGKMYRILRKISINIRKKTL